MLAVPAFGHQARLQRSVPHHFGIRPGRPPLLVIRATGAFPSAQMGQAEPAVAAGVHASGHRAGGCAEDRIADGGHQDIDPELRSHRCVQALGQGRPERRSSRFDAHRGWSWSASHPAATKARRASSIFRCA